MLVTWRCLMNFLKSQKDPEKSQKKIVKHHQVTSTPKTHQKLAWNNLTLFWLNFEKNRRLLFVLHGPSPTYNGIWLYRRKKKDFPVDTLICGKKSKSWKANPKNGNHQRTHISRKPKRTLRISEQKLSVRNFGPSNTKVFWSEAVIFTVLLFQRVRNKPDHKNKE